ncbi:hypothetical protein N5D48_16350 [Pseudomonas sp. GD03858]|uniref:hypothetical protein n=1 Tax=unclassified Pseudomonas TaxID=196821 RepID=UPI00244AB0A5|nr:MULTISPECIES: hypothetical protein [unclassified Pseudomonas]MDH0647538.1 hypothetical protein [Pseudomonas sp. GD03867]MDH0663981.1 hypothetical protein [Pseudomonas sp. GD03858]
MKKRLLALALSTLIINFARAESSDCSSVLKLQEYRNSSDYSLNMAYLHLVDESNYESAKKSASASYADLFSGSWDEFKTKRSQRFEKLDYNVDINDSREVYRASLSPEQISGWLSCMRQSAQPIIWYGHTDKLGADLEIEWQPTEDLGPLKDLEFSSRSGVAQNLPKQIKGKYGFHISRSVAGNAISGSVNSFTRSYFWEQKQLRSVRIFVPPIKESAPSTPPEKISVSMDNKIISSWAYWAGKHYPENTSLYRTEFSCFTGEKGMDMVRVTPDKIIHLPRRTKGYCVPNPSNYCDAGDESCTDIAISTGCLINKTWHDWYNKKMAASGLDYSASQVCDKGN